MITVGSTVPELVVEAYRRGEPDFVPCTLAQHDRWLVLFFYPRDFTFVCPTELAAFAELEQAFAAEEADLVAVSTDSAWSHKAWFETHAMLGDVAYPILADTTHELSEAFGVLTADGSALRGTFVIDPNGVVRHASITDQSVGRSPEETLRVLQALRTGELCPVRWQPGEATLKLAA
jgi:peroxiredoxin (alkyl hydroperoxide reductase subunit C)